MKSRNIIALMAASTLLTGCHKMSTATLERLKQEAATEQVVGYASTGGSTTTNISLVVTEIWKGSEQASRLGITNGTHFLEGSPQFGTLPDGAVFLLSADTNAHTSNREVIWVRSGRVEHITVQEFKAKIGL